MTHQNLWGNLESVDPVRTPTVILQEQAGLLGQLTNEILEGEVSRSPVHRKPNSIAATLYVVAPALKNYAVRILSIEYTLAVAYPALVYNSMDDDERQAKSEEELVGILGEILSSENVRKIISSLIAESQLSSRD